MEADDIIRSDLSWQHRAYEDGVIKVKAPKGWWRKSFRRLEDELGLNFKFVKREKRAELICRWEDTQEGSSGLARRLSSTQYLLTADPGRWYSKRVVLHEIGHGLGLIHNHEAPSMMSYERMFTRRWFFPLDLEAIQQVFDL